MMRPVDTSLPVCILDIEVAFDNIIVVTTDKLYLSKNMPYNSPTKSILHIEARKQ